MEQLWVVVAVVVIAIWLTVAVIAIVKRANPSPGDDQQVDAEHD